MIAANGVIARFLEAQGLPGRAPGGARARALGSHRRDRRRARRRSCPASPTRRALDEFLAERRAADPLRFPDLSLAVIKLLGPGEYVATLPGRARRPATSASR